MIKAETDRKADVEPRRLRVFLCHSSDDKPAVRDLYHRLCADGLDVWLDEEKLLPGQDWKQEISKAVRAADVVIVCLSCGSVAKAGYGQKEIKFALDVADEQPEGTIFLIPLKLEKCDVPERLSRWQWVDLTAAKGYERLMRALRERAKTRGMMLVPSSTEQGAKRYVQKRLLDAARDPIWQMIGAIVAILGLAWAVSISHLDPSGSGSQTPSPEATPTPVSGNIRFSSIPNSKTLNPDLRWDAGSSERSNYTLLPDMITLTAGPETWPGFPSISYKYPAKGDFDVQVRLTFSPSVPKLESNAQMAGLIVRPVNARLFALDVTFPGNWIVNRKSVTDAGLDIGCRGSFGEYLKDDAYLRIERAGDSWRCAYSEKGDNWIWIAPKVENSGILSDGVEIVLFAYSTSKSPIAVQFTDWAVYDR